VDLILEGDFGRVAVEIKHASTVNARELRGLGDFVRSTSTPGLVVNNDCAVRKYDEKLLGLPFNWL